MMHLGQESESDEISTLSGFELRIDFLATIAAPTGSLR